MYGLIARIRAAPGQRDALASILVAASADMPGCLSYVVARDVDDPDGHGQELAGFFVFTFDLTKIVTVGELFDDGGHGVFSERTDEVTGAFKQLSKGG